ncbi:MAG TPA: heme exporter protein CcmB [Caulobacteraceae bacterium]|nr:heme exporter protein CcmB [Caulobacteraceae bacterium]
MNPFIAILRRELAVSWAGGGGPLVAIGFFIALTSLAPLALGGDPVRLAEAAPGIAWLVLALASLISLERMFERDFEDGALDLIALGPAPLELAAFVKAIAQWATTQAPLALVAPLLMVALGAPWRLAPVALAAALAGGFGFAFLGGVGAALSLGSRRGGVLIALLVLPLFTPPVIFGAGAIEAFAAHLDWRTPLLLLAAYALAAAALCPFAMAAAARNALS